VEGTVFPICADVSDMPVVTAEIAKLMPIHLLVNNAGVGQLQHFLDVTTDAYDRFIFCFLAILKNSSVE